MTLDAFIKQINETIPVELRDELSLESDMTASETLTIISESCTELYEHLGEKLPEWLLDTFNHSQLISHNLHLNAIRIAGNCDSSKPQRFLYTIPIPTRFDKDIIVYQYGNADITVTRGNVSVFNNQSSVTILTGSHVKLFAKSRATVDGKAIVRAFDSTYLTVQGNPMVKAEGNCYVVVKGDAAIEASDNVNIEIQGGSPIISADRYVRIANCVKPDSGETVRLMIGKTVLVASYANNETIFSHTGVEKAPHIWTIDEYDPSMQQFIENMRSRYERTCNDKSPRKLTIDPDFIRSQKALLALSHNMPQIESKGEIQADLKEAISHQDLLKTIESHMELFVKSGLNHRLLDANFTHVQLIMHGIYSSADFIHHVKPDVKQIYLFGQEHFVITQKGTTIHAYENTIVLGNDLNIDLHDHSMALSQTVDKAQLSGHSLSGGISAKLLTLSGYSFAHYGDTGMVTLSEKSKLINYQSSDIVTLNDQAEAYYFQAPTRINKNSETSQLHYVREADEPFVVGSSEGIISHEKADDLKTVLKTCQAQKIEQMNRKQRGR